MKSTFAWHRSSMHIVFQSNNGNKFILKVYHVETGLVPSQLSSKLFLLSRSSSRFSYSCLAKFVSNRLVEVSFYICVAVSIRVGAILWIRSSYFLEIRIQFHIEFQQKGCWLRLTLNWNEALSFPLKNNVFFSRCWSNLYTFV